MRRYNIAVFLMLLVVAGALRAEAPRSHAHLDWSASRRWVHVDNVDPQKIQVFEDARKWWLDTLEQGDSVLGDGRPLFWCGHASDTPTYFTFYPFNTWGEMDQRGEMIRQTQSVVGDSAVKKYDTGDASLIPPHYSQIWRRVATSDVVWSGTGSLTELSAPVGRLEVRQVDWDHWDEAMEAWKQVQAALVGAQYPLACRAYTNVFGDNQGEYFLFWLAADSAQYRKAEPVEAALGKAVGSEKAAALWKTVEQYFPVQKSYEMERRLDLSNLGK